MTTEEFKEITRAVVLALRQELTPDNKDVLDKLSVVEKKLQYDGESLSVDISAEPNNNLCKKSDGLYAMNNYVTTESSPVGEIIAFMGKTAPEHYLFCDGTEYPIGTYPLLEQFFIDQFGTVNYFGGNGTTTFAVPDLRGEFLRGTGTNGHTNQGNGENVGVHQDGTEIPHTYSFANSFGMYNGKNTNDFNNKVSKQDKIISTASYYVKYDTSVGVYDDNLVATYGEQVATYTSKPTNTSVMYCIRYETIHQEQYSLEEQRIGTWIDGSPIYRKIFTGNINDSSQQFVNVTDLRIKEIISCNGFVKRPDISCYSPVAQYYALWIQDGYINIFNNGHGSYPNGSPVTIILEYTKNS